MSDVIRKFERRAEAVNSLVCVGLDPEDPANSGTISG